MPHNLQLRSHRGFLAERYDIFRRAGQHFVCVYQSLDIPSRRGTPHATLVPPKVRDLIAELHAAGFVNRGGKGSHRNFVHPKGSVRVTISGALGDDAKPYQIHAVEHAIEESKE